MMQHLTPESLEDLANTTMERFAQRIHEVPAKDLPTIAKGLLDLADARRPKPESVPAQEPIKPEPTTPPKK